VNPQVLYIPSFYFHYIVSLQVSLEAFALGLLFLGKLTGSILKQKSAQCNVRSVRAGHRFSRLLRISLSRCTCVAQLFMFLSQGIDPESHPVFGGGDTVEACVDAPISATT
jgi:hypothetical protein